MKVTCAESEILSLADTSTGTVDTMSVPMYFAASTAIPIASSRLSAILSGERCLGVVTGSAVVTSRAYKIMRDIIPFCGQIRRRDEQASSLFVVISGVVAILFT